MLAHHLGVMSEEGEAPTIQITHSHHPLRKQGNGSIPCVVLGLGSKCHSRTDGRVESCPDVPFPDLPSGQAPLLWYLWPTLGRASGGG